MAPTTTVVAAADAVRLDVSVAVALIDSTEPGPREGGTAMRAR